MLECYRRIPYIVRHRNAFRCVERNLTGRVVYGWLHDLDKLLMCVFTPFLGWVYINQIHVKKSKHHFEYFGGIEKLNKIEMLIDWECAHLTKDNVCENAVCYLNKYHKDKLDCFRKDVWSLFGIVL